LLSVHSSQFYISLVSVSDRSVSVNVFPPTGVNIKNQNVYLTIFQWLR